LIRRHYGGLSALTGAALKAADVNCDGVVNLVDLFAVGKKSIGKPTGIPWFP